MSFQKRQAKKLTPSPAPSLRPSLKARRGEPASAPRLPSPHPAGRSPRRPAARPGPSGPHSRFRPAPGSGRAPRKAAFAVRGPLPPAFPPPAPRAGGNHLEAAAAAQFPRAAALSNRRRRPPPSLAGTLATSREGRREAGRPARLSPPVLSAKLRRAKVLRNSADLGDKSALSPLFQGKAHGLGNWDRLISKGSSSPSKTLN